MTSTPTTASAAAEAAKQNYEEFRRDEIRQPVRRMAKPDESAHDRQLENQAENIRKEIAKVEASIKADQENRAALQSQYNALRPDSGQLDEAGSLRNKIQTLSDWVARREGVVSSMVTALRTIENERAGIAGRAAQHAEDETVADLIDGINAKAVRLLDEAFPALLQLREDFQSLRPDQRPFSQANQQRLRMAQTLIEENLRRELLFKISADVNFLRRVEPHK